MTRLSLSLFFCVCCALLPAAQNVKTVGGVALANVKTVSGVAIANVKSIGGVDNTSGGACDTVAQSFETSDGTSTSSQQYVANLITASGSHVVCAIAMTIRRNASDTGSWTLEVRNDNAGVPGDTVFSTSEPVPVEDINSATTELEVFSFATPVNLTGSTNYFLTLNRGTGVAGSMTLVRGNTSPENIQEGIPGSWSTITTSRGALYIIYTSS